MKMTSESELARQAVGRGRLPHPQGDELRCGMRRLGFKFKGGVFADPYVTLPRGWALEAAEGCVYDILDNKQRVRGSVRYYPLPGYLTLKPRFEVSCDGAGSQGWGVFDHLAGKNVFVDRSIIGDGQINSAKVWLFEHYPKWQNPTYYWD